VALIVGGLLIYSCHHDSEAKHQQKVEAAIEDRAAEIQAGTYQDTYGDEGCTLDCSGHVAGFAWAREHNITDENDCDAHGDADSSFAQGCKAFVNADDEAQSEHDDKEDKDDN
jgi:hypothetical protein